MVGVEVYRLRSGSGFLGGLSSFCLEPRKTSDARYLCAPCAYELVREFITSVCSGALMRILAIEHEQPGAVPQDFQRLGKAEAARAWELYQTGQMRELYFRQDRPEVQLAHLAGLITFEIIPLAPYPGFARLFSREKE
jgi:hypothetical protein